jgi:hypothetical protein
VITATGFQGWGIVYFVIWLVLVAFLFVRTVGRDAVRTVTLPFADWVFYVWAGALMAVCLLIARDTASTGLSLEQGSIGLVLGFRAGWWLAMLAAVAVCLGGVMKRDRDPAMK